MKKSVTNRDISVEEFNAFASKRSSEMRQVFDTMDRDRNEYIDMREAQDVLQRMNLDEKKFQALWNRLDKNKDGRVSPPLPFPSFASHSSPQRIVYLPLLMVVIYPLTNGNA